jgi:hypothetical protein
MTARERRQAAANVVTAIILGGITFWLVLTVFAAATEPLPPCTGQSTSVCSGS